MVQCCYAERRKLTPHAECRYAECHYAECSGDGLRPVYDVINARPYRDEGSHEIPAAPRLLVKNHKADRHFTYTTLGRQVTSVNQMSVSQLVIE